MQMCFVSHTYMEVSAEVPAYPAKEHLFCPTISVFVMFLQLLSSAVLNAIFNIDPLDEVAPVLWIEPPTLGLQGRSCSCWATLGHANVVFKIMVRFKIMIILVFLNAFLNNLSTFKTGFHRLCIKTSAEDEKNSCFDQNFLKCNLNQYEVLKRNWDQNEFFSTTITFQLICLL